MYPSRQEHSNREPNRETLLAIRWASLLLYCTSNTCACMQCLGLRHSMAYMSMVTGEHCMYGCGNWCMTFNCAHSLLCGLMWKHTKIPELCTLMMRNVHWKGVRNMLQERCDTQTYHLMHWRVTLHPHTTSPSTKIWPHSTVWNEAMSSC